MSRTDATADARFLIAAASRLETGAILSIARPNSLFKACLAMLDWRSSEHFMHASPAALKEPGPFASFAERWWPHSGYRKQILAESKGRLLLASGQIVDQDTIDALYGVLRRCVAIEVDAKSWPCLKGAGELIRRCRPMLAIEWDPEVAPPIMTLLREYGYVVVDSRGDEITNERVIHTGYVLAFPKADNASSFLNEDGLSAPQASPRRLVTRRRLETSRDPLSGWNCSIEAMDLCLLPGILERHSGGLRRWTGPGHSSRIFLWVPAEGSYKFRLEIDDCAYSRDLSPGTLTHALEPRESVNLGDAIELLVSISRSESRDALVVTLVTPQIGRRYLVDRDCRVGVAISRLRINRLGVSEL